MGEFDDADWEAIQREYQAALREKRRPRCVYCGADLVIVQEYADEDRYVWDRERGRFTRINVPTYGGTARCKACGRENKYFLWPCPETVRLGLCP